MSQTYLPPGLRVMVPVSVRIPIASRASTVPLMVRLPTTVPTQFRVCAVGVAATVKLPRPVTSKVPGDATAIIGVLANVALPLSATVPALTARPGGGKYVPEDIRFQSL